MNRVGVACAKRLGAKGAKEKMIKEAGITVVEIELITNFLLVLGLESDFGVRLLLVKQ